MSMELPKDNLELEERFRRTLAINPLVHSCYILYWKKELSLEDALKLMVVSLDNQLKLTQSALTDLCLGLPPDVYNPKDCIYSGASVPLEQFVKKTRGEQP